LSNANLSTGRIPIQPVFSIRGEWMPFPVRIGYSIGEDPSPKMPKEITHWLVSEAVSKKLEGTCFEAPLRDNTNLLHLGAIIHDVPYYYLKADVDSRFGSLPIRLHGTVDDARELVETFLRHLLAQPEKERTQLTAFLVGLITHLFADALMHPLIFYLTGPYHDPDFRRRTVARQQHRMLEALIDMCLVGGYSQIRGYSLAAYIRNAEMPLQRLHEHLEKAWLGDEDTERFAEGLQSSFRLFSFLQFLCRSRFFGSLAPVVFPVVPSSVREVLALVYSPKQMSQCWRIEGEIPCRHPSTGELRAHRIVDLFREAVDRSAEFCLAIEPVFRPGPNPPPSWSLPAVDPSLSLDPEHPLRFYAPGTFFD
jgi:hypothetical protein